MFQTEQCYINGNYKIRIICNSKFCGVDFIRSQQIREIQS